MPLTNSCFWLPVPVAMTVGRYRQNHAVRKERFEVLGGEKNGSGSSDRNESCGTDRRTEFGAVRREKGHGQKRRNKDQHGDALAKPGQEKKSSCQRPKNATNDV
jgi:hypothetical protein